MSAVLNQAAHNLIDPLPDRASWADLMCQAVLHRTIERGLAEADAGQLIPV
jgi:predicted transcriptional regulator